MRLRIVIVFLLGMTLLLAFNQRKSYWNTFPEVQTALLILDPSTIPTVNVVEEPIDFFPSTDKEHKWVDSVYQHMSLEQKIGQLFMVAAYSNKNEAHAQSLDKLIEEQYIGGLIFFQGGPVRQARLTNRFQSKSKVPLFIGIDAEWGLSMRLDSTYRYPWNMTLGALPDEKLIEELGKQMAQQSKRLGIHFNFSPVLDINTNPRNPIIGNRSFGEDKENVTEKASALMKGLQANGVFATGKHFPGHGDTDKDSHYTLPTVNFDESRIQDIELYPYKKLIKRGMASVMVAHLNVPALEERSNYPSSISHNIVTNVLKKELGFEGLIFTDALNMKGASNFKSPGEIDLEAFMAGNDILLFPENVPLAMNKIKEALDSGMLSQKRLDESVKKILAYKYKAGLHQYKPIDELHLNRDLNTAEFEALNLKLFEESQTLLQNKQNLLPLKELDKQKIAYVKLGDDEHSTFLESLREYADVVEVSDSSLLDLNEQLKHFTTVIIGFHKADGAWKNHDFKENELVWLDEIARKNKVIFTVFAKPYSLLPLTTFENLDSVLLSYQNHILAHKAAAQAIFGANDIRGILPVSIGDFFSVGHGLQTKHINRLGFGIAENVGMCSLKLSRIDHLANEAINNKMAPGMQILVARKGKVIYHKAFGFHTYEPQIPVHLNTMYDVASLTKISATLPAVMQLYDQDKIHMNTKLGEMLPILKGTDKEKINFKEFLSHYAKLQAWLPFYKETLDTTMMPSERYYRKNYSPEFSLQVSENLYLRTDYADTIIQKIAESKLLPKKEYKYSDFTFILLKKYIEKATRMGLDDYVQQHFYRSLGTYQTTYNPLQKFDMSLIAPSEKDTYFRNQILQGYVHDMTAAMEGGVGGHAGVFSTALDIAKIMQLYLQKGEYGGKRYFSKKTFEDFNTCYFCPEGNRRGIGFDKPQLGPTGPTCGCASMTSFGHTGFTGTMAWADPEQEIVYIFLSNRTFPDGNATNALSKNNVRENIQQVIYDAIIQP